MQLLQLLTLSFLIDQKNGCDSYKILVKNLLTQRLASRTVTEPKICSMRNNSRSKASLEWSAEDMVGDFTYFEDCYRKGLYLSNETQRTITKIKD